MINPNEQPEDEQRGRHRDARPRSRVVLPRVMRRLLPHRCRLLPHRGRPAPPRAHRCAGGPTHGPTASTYSMRTRAAPLSGCQPPAAGNTTSEACGPSCGATVVGGTPHAGGRYGRWFVPSEGIRLRSVNRYKTVSNTPNAPITMPTANAAGHRDRGHRPARRRYRGVLVGDGVSPLPPGYVKFIKV